MFNIAGVESDAMGWYSVHGCTNAQLPFICKISAGEAVTTQSAKKFRSISLDYYIDYY